jgi:rhodanese-related sulfurtransferase
MTHVSVEAFKEILQSEKDNNSVDFINVCTPAEYKEKHIPGVRSVPLDEIESHLAEFKDKQTVYVHCRGGTRSQKAIDKLSDLGIKASLVSVEGGIRDWESAGFETEMTLLR